MRNIPTFWNRSLYRFSNDTKATKLVNNRFLQVYTGSVLMIFKQYTLNGKRRVSNGKCHVIKRKQMREKVCGLCLNANSCILYQYCICLIVWYVVFVKNRFCHFRTFPWLLKKYAKSKQIYRNFAKLCPSPPSLFNRTSATVYVLQYSSFWNHKAKNYGIKTTSYAHKTTSYAHKTTSYAHKTTSYAHKTTSYAFKTYKFDSWN